MKFQGFTLDKFQEDAVIGVDQKHSVLVSAPTGSGKTLIADYIIDKYLKKDKRVIYTAPIKALSNQKFKDFTEQYGEDKIGLITGDVVINSEAQILIMTTEVYRNMAIIKDPILDDVAYCIMDEIHFISDEERGYIWEESIIFSPSNVRFLFLSATIPNSDEFADWVESIKEHDVAVIVHDIRAVPLERKFFDAEMGITDLKAIKEKKELDKYPEMRRGRGRGRFRPQRIPLPDYRDLVRDIRDQGKLPCIYFVFSRAKTQEYALKLAQKNDYLTRKEKEELTKLTVRYFKTISPEVKALQTTRDLQKCIKKGVAFHNAGILPDIKHVVEKLFGHGLIKVLFATETFAVGINMPAKTVCFDGLRKYTGTGFRYLNSKEYFQISGRAGRRGIDKTGLSVAIIHRPSADIGKIRSFTDKDTLPLLSQFKLTYNTALNLVNLHSREEIQTILQMNFFTYQKLKGRTGKKKVLASIKARFTNLYNQLTKLGYVEGDALTPIGQFASKIFSDELEVSQMFMTDFEKNLSEYDMLVLIAALVYEPRRGARFYKLFNQARNDDLVKLVKKHPVLHKKKWYENIAKMSSLTYPCYQQEKFMDFIKNANLPEGDMIRLLLRIMDKLEQIDKAIIDNPELVGKIRNCKHLLRDSLEGIHMF